MAIENSHNKRRVIGPRLSTMGEGPTPEQVEQRREQLRANATYRASKESSRGYLKALVGEATRKAMPSTATPEESRLVAENALTLAADAAREVASPSPFVAHHVTRFGVNAALAGFYTQQAAEAGFATPDGLAMVEAAQRAEQAATRAMAAAEAAVKAFAGKRPKRIDVQAMIDEAAKPRSAP